VLFIWWFSTGIILWLNRRSERVRRWSMAVTTVIAALAAYAVYEGATDTLLGGAYHAFTASLIIWGWIEMSFVMGFVTGPRRTACPKTARGWSRALFAFEAIAYHELALVIALAGIAVLSLDAPNQIAFWTVAVLWLMRLSAKLNIFLGVPNFTDEFLPPRLAYLNSYFRVRQMNGLFPIAVTLSTVGAVWLGIQAGAPGATAFEASGLTFLTTLLALAVLEHWFMVLPWRDAALWQWALNASKPAKSKAEIDHKARQKPVAEPAFKAVQPAAVP
jgi:putative photosynthetic complex assembly protein 2